MGLHRSAPTDWGSAGVNSQSLHSNPCAVKLRRVGCFASRRPRFSLTGGYILPLTLNLLLQLLTPPHPLYPPPPPLSTPLLLHPYPSLSALALFQLLPPRTTSLFPLGDLSDDNCSSVLSNKDAVIPASGPASRSRIWNRLIDSSCVTKKIVSFSTLTFLFTGN